MRSRLEMSVTTSGLKRQKYIIKVYRINIHLIENRLLELILV